MELETKIDKLKDDFSNLKSRLDSHLKVADVVDAGIKEKVEKMGKDVEAINNYIITQKAQKNSIDAGWGFFFKFGTFLCIVFGAIFSLFKGIMYLISKIQWTSHS